MLFISTDIFASGAFPLDDASTPLIGAVTAYIIKDRETLIDLAVEFDVGYNEIAAANRNVDPWVPYTGSEIVIPTAWILPDMMTEGIIINLAELRLYFFLTVYNKRYVRTYPIGIGRAGFNTPAGTFTITAKVKDPVWNVPDIVKKEHPELPMFVLPGPENPLGRYWLQLSIKGYGIHGTHRPYGIGRRVSYGCIRMYPEDIEVLSAYVKNGTIVKIIDEPVKAALIDEKVYVEIHASDIEESELLAIAIKELDRKNLLQYVESALLVSEVKNATGLPAVVSK